MRLGVDPRKADQMVRGTVNLPHGTGKTARVLVFATGERAEQATRRRRRHRRRRRADRRGHQGPARLRRRRRDPRPDGQGRPARPRPRPARPDAEPEDRHRHPGRRQGRRRDQGRQDRVPGRPQRQPALHHRQGRRSTSGSWSRTTPPRSTRCCGSSRRPPRAATSARRPWPPRWAPASRSTRTRRAACSRTPRRSPPESCADVLTLVLSSLLAVLALGCGGWLLDPAGSRQPFGLQSQARPQTPTQSGPVLYAAVTRQMVAEGTATYTYSGSSGGGETQSGSGVAALPPPGPDARTFDADVTVTSPTTGRMRAVLLPGAVYLALPPAKGLPSSKPWLQGVGHPQTGASAASSPRSRTRCAPRSTPARAWACSGPPAGSTEVGPATVEGVPTTQHRATISLRRATGWPRTRRPASSTGRCWRPASGPCSTSCGWTPAGCRARSGADCPDHPGPVLGDRGLPRLGRAR